jgi:hypothetical protein
MQQNTPSGGRQVKGDAALVGVEIQKRDTLFTVRFVAGEGPHAARQIALKGFNLDHLGTLIG